MGRSTAAWSSTTETARSFAKAAACTFTGGSGKASRAATTRCHSRRFMNTHSKYQVRRQSNVICDYTAGDVGSGSRQLTDHKLGAECPECSQDATAMYSYAAASAAASKVTPFTPAQQATNPGGLTGQAAAAAQAAGTSAGHAQTIMSGSQLMSAVPHALQAVASSAASTAASPGTGGLLGFTLPPGVSSLSALEADFSWQEFAASIWATAGTSWGIGAAQGALPAAEVPGVVGLGSAAAPAAAEVPAAAGLASASGPADGAAVSAGVGRAAPIGAFVGCRRAGRRRPRRCALPPWKCRAPASSRRAARAAYSAGCPDSAGRR